MFRIVSGICLIVAGLGLLMFVIGLALGTERFGCVDCLMTALCGLMVVGGILFLIPPGRREDRDDGGEW